MVTHINHYTELITNRYTYHFSIPFQNEAELSFRRPLPEIKEEYVTPFLQKPMEPFIWKTLRN